MTSTKGGRGFHSFPFWGTQMVMKMWSFTFLHERWRTDQYQGTCQREKNQEAKITFFNALKLVYMELHKQFLYHLDFACE
jgi:hypothetical protein